MFASKPNNMANTYTKLYIQLVFVVKHRQQLIQPQHREELQKYITGIVKNRCQSLLAIYCMPDHTHILLSVKPDVSISDLARDIKSFSTAYINQQDWSTRPFNWQRGFGAFSYSAWDVEMIKRYVWNQEEHHRKVPVKQEFLEYLKDYEIEWDERYMFDWGLEKDQ